MLSSINPLGERARNQRFWVTVTAYVMGSVLAGVAIGWLGGSLGSLIPQGVWRAVVLAVVAGVGAFMELTRRRPPSVHRQVNEDWLTRYRGWVYGLGFGLQLGLGVVTIVTTAAVYVLVSTTVLVGSALVGSVIGGLFGLARAAPIFSMYRVGDPASLRHYMGRLQGRLSTASALAVVAQLLIMGAAMAAVMRGDA